ncbi:hypothetical protein [Bradyrhizobium pachyrhizi]|uniref:hypothetical protein n=1 Tax=Bradyrhizobium pachyrhizi TaxID=280333 RepID=UPI000AAC3330|nr:hypothetical protein [Bradyrhizobium pachyrhizi]
MSHLVNLRYLLQAHSSALKHVFKKLGSVKKEHMPGVAAGLLLVLVLTIEFHNAPAIVERSRGITSSIATVLIAIGIARLLPGAGTPLRTSRHPVVRRGDYWISVQRRDATDDDTLFQIDRVEQRRRAAVNPTYDVSPASDPGAQVQ